MKSEATLAAVCAIIPVARSREEAMEGPNASFLQENEKSHQHQ